MYPFPYIFKVTFTDASDALIYHKRTKIIVCNNIGQVILYINEFGDDFKSVRIHIEKG